MEVKRSRVSSAIRTEGGLLPADLLGRIAAGDETVPGLVLADYGLEPDARFGEAITRSWNRLVGAWAAFLDARDAAEAAGERLTTATREGFLLPLLEELGFGRLSAARAVEIEGTSYPISHAALSVPIHLVGADVPLDKRTPGVRGAAGAAPHALVQELLNRSEERLWGFVSNGRTMRVLRDNSSLTRQAYLEFDLESIFTGQAYADFSLLWLVCHRSRFSGARHEDWIIERWTRLAADEGTRALESLRGGVTTAIETFGIGFLAAPPNAELRERLRSGDLDRQDYYRQLLRLVYRLIFLFTAEDRRDEATSRELLLDPEASDEAADRYRRYYSTARLRAAAIRRRGTRHGDLWASLRRVIVALGSDTGAPSIALPALGSFLFGSNACPDLDAAELRNEDLLTAVRQLATIEEDRRLRNVDYGNLGAEELGSVYESLLELHPRLEMEATPPAFSLSTAAGNERKTTGSYYTPSSLIDCLLDSALEPVLDEAVAKPDAETAILELSVVDPAAGSGHFLVGAAHRIAKRLAAVRSGEGEPPPPEVRHALRDVISHCIYAVDLNPMAVELCKVSLWLEALEPGKPLTFLDAHIKTGNSLLGTTPELVEAGIPDEAFKPLAGDEKPVARAWRARNRKEREGQQTLFGAGFELPVAELAKGSAGVDALADEDPRSVREKEKQARRYLGSDAYRRSIRAADAWCAAFMLAKTADTPEVTTDVVRTLGLGNPAPHADALVAAMALEHSFFHWPLEFPQVFAQGGFSVVVGNPPYIDSETLTREAPRLRATLGWLYDSAQGNWDIYVAFVDLATSRLSMPGGYAALLTPVRVVAADYCVALQEDLLKREVLSFRDFSRVDAFDDASVAVGSLTVRNRAPSVDAEVAFVEYAEDMSVARIEHAPQVSLSSLPPGYIGFPLRGGSAQLLAVYAARDRVKSLADVSDGASTAEAYEIRSIVCEGLEGSVNDEAMVRLVNTGTIDPFHIKWGEVTTAYLRGRFDHPVVPVAALERVAPKRLIQAQQPKVMVGGMGSRLEAVADDGGLLCGKSAVLLIPRSTTCAYALAALLNSALVNELYRGLFGLRGMGVGSMNIGPRQVEQLPVPLDSRTLAPATRHVTVEDLGTLASLGDSDLREQMRSQKLLSGISRLLHGLPPDEGAFRAGSELVDRITSLALQSGE